MAGAELPAATAWAARGWPAPEAGGAGGQGALLAGRPLPPPPAVLLRDSPCPHAACCLLAERLLPAAAAAPGQRLRRTPCACTPRAAAACYGTLRHVWPAAMLASAACASCTAIAALQLRCGRAAWLHCRCPPISPTLLPPLSAQWERCNPHTRPPQHATHIEHGFHATPVVHPKQATQPCHAPRNQPSSASAPCPR